MCSCCWPWHTRELTFALIVPKWLLFLAYLPRPRTSRAAAADCRFSNVKHPSRRSSRDSKKFECQKAVKKYGDKTKSDIRSLTGGERQVTTI